MTVWVKTKPSTLDIDIPHNTNFANAMYGFLELGAIVEPYYKIEDIYDKVTREDIVIDYVDQCLYILSKFGVEPNLPDYPDVLTGFLGRKVWRDTINHIASDEKLWSAGYFVKPIRQKAFTGRVINSIADLQGCGSCYEDYEVLVCEPLDMVAEWRCFIKYDEIIDVRPYGSVIEQGYVGYKYHYDTTVLMAMLNKFKTWEDRPNACSMDICVTKTGETCLVEMNDAYALGCYGLPCLLYAKFISARWSQLLNRKDEFDFR